MTYFSLKNEVQESYVLHYFIDTKREKAVIDLSVSFHDSIHPLLHTYITYIYHSTHPRLSHSSHHTFLNPGGLSIHLSLSQLSLHTFLTPSVCPSIHHYQLSLYIHHYHYKSITITIITSYIYHSTCSYIQQYYYTSITTTTITSYIDRKSVV